MLDGTGGMPRHAAPGAVLQAGVCLAGALAALETGAARRNTRARGRAGAVRRERGQMQITDAEVVRLRVPFTDGGKGEGLFHNRWRSLDFVLLKLGTDTGLTGWGEAFSYFSGKAVWSLTRTAVVPQLIGRDPRDPDPILRDLKQKLHIIGRYGVTMHCISAADIALWDLAAKAEGVSLAERIGGRRRGDVPAYASLVRYADDPLIGEMTARAVAEGYRTIKLHEIEPGHIRAGRAAAGPDVALTVDVNCNWTLERTLELAPELREIGLHWLEEPIFPPEDFAGLARLRRETRIPIATGENACTEYQFAAMLAAGAADFVQPSVTKIGGISEVLATRRRAREAGVKVAQHSPYFGPGYLASLQLLAAADEEELFEYLYIDREDEVIAGLPVPSGGRIAIPDGPGLGLDPDEDVLERYSI
jgi:L-alanine-DL-glutamate epimerase-like enolase superfamily enzyme